MAWLDRVHFSEQVCFYSFCQQRSGTQGFIDWHFALWCQEMGGRWDTLCFRNVFQDYVDVLPLAAQEENAVNPEIELNSNQVLKKLIL